MRKRLGRRVIAIAALILVAMCAAAYEKRTLIRPMPSDEAQVALGQQIFNDPHLSADNHIRCASCHQPDHGYADGKPLAIGVFGRIGTRNTPSLASITQARDTSFFWDGRRTHLQQAVLDPLTNPVEMGLTDNAALLDRLKQNTTYDAAFERAFPSSTTSITVDEVAIALSAYVRSLGTRTSAYDRYAQGDQAALSPLAEMGLAIFKGNGQCAECHRLDGTPAALTDHDFHRTGVGMDAIEQSLSSLTMGVIDRSLQDAAIGVRVATHSDEAQLGRFNVTRDPADIGLFRTPSLRGVSLTAPYMHDGSVATLDEAIDREVYYRGLQAGHPLNLSVEDRQALKAFLQAL